MVDWKKSSFCGGDVGCVEVAFFPIPEKSFVILHSPDGGAISYSYDEWRVFVAGVKNGEFDVED